MSIGASIFFIAVGAILAFAVNVAVKGVELDVVGYILMGVGVLGLILSMILYRRTRVPPGGVVVEERPPDYPPRY